MKEILFLIFILMTFDQCTQYQSKKYVKKLSTKDFQDRCIYEKFKIRCRDNDLGDFTYEL